MEAAENCQKGNNFTKLSIYHRQSTEKIEKLPLKKLKFKGKLLQWCLMPMVVCRSSFSVKKSAITGVLLLILHDFYRSGECFWNAFVCVQITCMMFILFEIKVKIDTS